MTASRLHGTSGVASERVSDLEIDQDLTFQRRSWTVQRVGWVIMVAVVAGAAAGLFGSGPLSRASVDVPGLMRVEYQRFSRFQTSEALAIHVEAPATVAGRVRLGLDRRFLDHSKLTSIIPAPVRVEGRSARVIYEFAMAAPGEPLTVTVLLEPEHLGPGIGDVSLEAPVAGDGGPAGVARFRQFVYP